MRIFQEWYCTKSGGGCGGYIIVKLNACINGVVELVCPKCGHKHQRCIENGQIKEQGRFNGNPVEEICPTMASWSEKPHTAKMTPVIGEKRNGVQITDADLVGADSPGIMDSICAFFKG